MHPFTGSVRTRYAEVNGLDSTWVKAGNASIAFSILPSASDPQVPMIRTRIESRGLAARSLENIYVLRGAGVNLEAILFNTRRRIGAAARPPCSIRCNGFILRYRAIR
ncbi:MAG: hypothetical protein ACLR8Y_17620 [Alistipes indistinctus]